MHELKTLVDLDRALVPTAGPTVLYKHSTQCGICDGAIEEIRAFLRKSPEAATFYYLDLLEHRDVSNEISKRLGVKHESPQALVLVAGQVTAVLNHRAIRLDALAKALATIK